MPLPSGCRYQAPSAASVPAIASQLKLPPAVLLAFNRANGTAGGGWSAGRPLACGSTVAAGASVAIPCPGPAAEGFAEAARRQGAPGC